MIDTRFQLILDDIDAAVASRKAGNWSASNAAIDDARTKLVDIAEEGPGLVIMSFINIALNRLDKALDYPDFDYLSLARAAVERVSGVGA